MVTMFRYEIPAPVSSSRPPAGPVPVDRDDPRYHEPLVDLCSAGVAGWKMVGCRDGQSESLLPLPLRFIGEPPHLEGMDGAALPGLDLSISVPSGAPGCGEGGEHLSDPLVCRLLAPWESTIWAFRLRLAHEYGSHGP